MQKMTLYRFTRPDGGVTVSPVKPDGEYTELFRLVADEGMVLTDGVTTTTCTDTESPDVWQEVADAETEDMEAKAHAYDIITGVAE